MTPLADLGSIKPSLHRGLLPREITENTKAQRVDDGPVQGELGV